MSYPALSEEIGAFSTAAGGVMTALFAAVLSAALVVLLFPLLKRYALAKPNARSSHSTPTPQGGGIAVIAAMIVAIGVALGFHWFGSSLQSPLPAVIAAAAVMACLGVLDDIHPLPAGPRLLLQTILVAAVIYTLPGDLRVVPMMPWWLERVLLVLGGVWFVNLVNFMDGVDWMTVVEFVPVTAALAIVGGLGALPPQGIVVTLSLCGALIGFAWFNRPIAKLFLGDVGSLPIGLLVGWLLLLVATRGHLTAAIVMPLYYLADATVTLLRRLARREPVWLAHRMHFYQLAINRGFVVPEVVAWVFVVNVCLCALAIVTVIVPGRLSDVAALLGGAILVTGLLFTFARGKSKRQKQ
jgi:UDP-N-acetylmuramyl pentapeptide phosphotransferase/UDP-N-acetylglucosamine-1-phosphate transferase